MNFLNRDKAGVVYYTGLLLLAVGLPLSLFVMSIAQFVLLAAFIVEKDYRGRLQNFLTNIPVLALTGIYLMRTGRVEANLVKLNEEFQLPYIADLVERKLAGPELSKLPEGDFSFHENERNRLEQMLRSAHEQSHLPELPSATAALDDLLVRLRMK